VVGEAVDSVIFYPVAFYGTFSNELLVSVLVGNYAAKVLWEVLATPLTYKIVTYLKRLEQEDYYDVNELHFTPFSLQV
jgi:queuosine precursor transporter